MKYLIFISAIFFASTAVFSQSNESKSDKLQALMVARITEEISLTSEEAQSFWPLFNEIRETRKAAERKKRKLIKDIEKNYSSLKESDARKYVEEMRMLEEAIGASYFSDKHRQIIKIIGAKRFLKLQKAEMDFRRDMIKKYKHRHRNKK